MDVTVNRELCPPSLADYARLIMRVGLTSFGGGISGWMMRLVVHERGWMTEAEFLNGLALCQVFPGVNVLNLSIWLGYKLHGTRGALTGALAIIVPPAFVLIGMAALFAHLSQSHAVRAGLDGVAAAAIGLTGTMGARAFRRAATSALRIAIAITTTVLVGVLHVPLIPVVIGMSAIGVALAFREEA